MIIGIDVDGILADFNSSFIPLIKQLFNIELPPASDTYPNTWYYDIAGGVSKEQSREAWKLIAQSRNFWLDLSPYPETNKFLRMISNRHDDIYFVTQRPGKTAKFQTETWLKRNGFHGHPTVLVSGNKGIICNCLGVNLYIDDKNENCVDVVRDSPNTVCYRVPRPWNNAIPGTTTGTLRDFGNLIENGVAA